MCSTPTRPAPWRLVVHYYPLVGNYTGQLAALPLELQQYVIDALQQMAQLP